MTKSALSRFISLALAACVSAAALVLIAPATPASAYPATSMGLRFVTTMSNEDVEIGMGGTLTGVVINWGDSEDLTPTIVPTGNNVADTFYRHTYQLPGTYTVTISGTTMSHFGKCSSPANYWNLEAVLSWGSLGTTDLSCAFWNRSGMTSVPSTIPANVSNLYFAFNGTHIFNQDLSGWATSGVTSMEGAFRGAYAFNNGGVAFAWNTSTVTNMRNMFSGASAFNQSLATWNISAVTDMAGMLGNSGMDSTNYSYTLVGWASRTVQPNVTLDATTQAVAGCPARRARFTLVNSPNSWSITDASVTTTCPAQTVTWAPTNTSNVVQIGGIVVTPNIAPVGSSTGIIMYRVISDTTSMCTVSTAWGDVTAQQAGTCVVRAEATATATEESGGTDVTFIFTAATAPASPVVAAPATAAPAELAATGLSEPHVVTGGVLSAVALLAGIALTVIRRRNLRTSLG